jgi:hypothetical protein
LPTSTPSGLIPTDDESQQHSGHNAQDPRSRRKTLHGQPTAATGLDSEDWAVRSFNGVNFTYISRRKWPGQPLNKLFQINGHLVSSGMVRGLQTASLSSTTQVQTHSEAFMKARVLLLLPLMFLPQIAHADLINPGFETGNFTGWTTFTTPNGTLGDGFPQVVLFDTNNDSIPSLAAQFRVGQQVLTTGVFEGGGIFQSVLLAEGPMVLSVDIAAADDAVLNNAGGLFQLIFDGSVVASHNFANIGADTVEYGTLSYATHVTAGSHEVRIQMSRPFLQGCGRGPCTPTQYVDNVRITSSVPEPVTLLLCTLGLSGLAAARLSKR